MKANSGQWIDRQGRRPSLRLVVKITGMAFWWIGSTTALGAVVRKPYGIGAGYGTPGLSYAGSARVMLAGANGKDMEFFEVAKAVREMWIGLRGKHGWWLGRSALPFGAHTNKAGAPTPPAGWYLKAWCRSAAIGLIRLAGRSTGSR